MKHLLNIEIHLRVLRMNILKENNLLSLISVLMLEALIKIKFTLSSHFIEEISEEEILFYTTPSKRKPRLLEEV